MHGLKFTLTPAGVARVHDAVICLSKFSETVSIEARPDKLSLTALNSSKSAYACFCLDGADFFDEYLYSSNFSERKRPDGVVEARFTCQVYNKALLSVFKSRLLDVRERDSAIERCEVSIQDQLDKTECRLVIKMVCKHGVIKTYRLTYESIEVMHALFNKDSARNKWKISATALRSFIEYFGSSTEQLDLYSENGRVTMTSYTEKIMSGREILKQPLQTSIAIDTLDFEEYAAEDMIHIGISVKDFKAIVMHAETLKASVTALYSHPTLPMRLAYEEHGMQCEFTLMTIGDYRSDSVTPSPAVARKASSAPPNRQSSNTSTAPPRPQTQASAMPPPVQPASRSYTRELPSQRPPRPSPPPPKVSLDSESLFLSSEEEDDRKWGEKSFDQEEDTLGWDQSINSASRAATFKKSDRDGEGSSRLEPYPASPNDTYNAVAPTQRISEIPSLFDD